jgi:REP element-mobilizing transposase RayT
MKNIKAALQDELRKAGWHSRGYLPHFDGGEIAQTITLQLGDSLPQAVLGRWRRELSAESAISADAVLRRRIEYHLNQGYGVCALKDVRVAKMVQDSLLHFDGQRYWLSAWVVMPNHVHMLLTPNAHWSLSEIMKSFKSYTSHEANKILGQHGQFWIEDYFDRYVRDEKHFANAIAYIENNPVEARLCGKPEDWPFSSAWFRAKRSG